MKMKMNKTKSIICFIISIAVVLFLGYVVMFGVGGRHTGSAQNVTQGLDLMGGTSVSYQVDESKTKSFTATDLEDTRLKLENRVHTFSSEATAYKEGDDRITVDIPGEYDADAVVEELSLVLYISVQQQQTNQQMNRLIITNMLRLETTITKFGYQVMKWQTQRVLLQRTRIQEKQNMLLILSLTQRVHRLLVK